MHKSNLAFIARELSGRFDLIHVGEQCTQVFGVFEVVHAEESPRQYATAATRATNRVAVAFADIEIPCSGQNLSPCLLCCAGHAGHARLLHWQNSLLHLDLLQISVQHRRQLYGTACTTETITVVHSV